MSTQTELTNNFSQYVLYYCNYVNSDPTLFNLNLSQICTLAYDTYPIITITNWLPAYAQPSNATLLTFVASTVSTWYDNYYTKPTQIMNSQFRISSANLANVRTDSTMTGVTVYDTTSNVQKMFNGTSWINYNSLCLPSNSDIDLTNHNINNVVRLNQSSPSFVNILSTTPATITFTAATSKAIDLPTLTGTSSSDFSFNTNGRCTYTGSSTRYFQVSINYSVNTLVPISVQTLTTYLSKNGSTTISGPRNIKSFILVVGLNYTYSETLNCIIQLAQNDTVQLFGNYSAAGGVTFNNISYNISQI